MHQLRVRKKTRSTLQGQRGVAATFARISRVVLREHSQHFGFAASLRLNAEVVKL